MDTKVQSVPLVPEYGFCKYSNDLSQTICEGPVRVRLVLTETTFDPGYVRPDSRVFEFYTFLELVYKHVSPAISYVTCL